MKYSIFNMKYLIKCTYLFKFKVSLYLLLFSTLEYASKLPNPMWPDLPNIDNLENS